MDNLRTKTRLEEAFEKKYGMDFPLEKVEEIKKTIFTPSEPVFKREEIWELGKKGPYCRYVEFPVEVKEEIKVLGKDELPNIRLDNKGRITNINDLFDGEPRLVKTVREGAGEVHTYIRQTNAYLPEENPIITKNHGRYHIQWGNVDLVEHIRYNTLDDSTKTWYTFEFISPANYKIGFEANRIGSI